MTILYCYVLHTSMLFEDTSGSSLSNASDVSRKKSFKCISSIKYCRICSLDYLLLKIDVISKLAEIDMHINED